MRWPAIARLLLAVGLGGLAGVKADEATARQELDACLTRCNALLRQSFTLPVKSPEINALISQQVSQKTQQAFGNPLQITVSHFTYTHAATGGTIYTHLSNLPAAQAEMMEKQANQLIQGSAVGQMLEVVAFDALKEGILYLNAQKAQCVLRKETPEAVDFSLSGGNQELMPGLQLKESWFRLDRKAKAVTGIQFRFANGKSMMARVMYAEVRLPGGGSAPVPKTAEITQDALTTPQDGVTVPAKVTVQYGACTFLPAAGG